MNDVTIENSLIGLRSIIGLGYTIRSTYVMGADIYEDDEAIAGSYEGGIPPIGIEGTTIERAIIDKDARLGRNVRIVNEKGRTEYSDGIVIIRDGIAVVPRRGVVPDGYVI